MPGVGRVTARAKPPPGIFRDRFDLLLPQQRRRRRFASDVPPMPRGRQASARLDDWLSSERCRNGIRRRRTWNGKRNRGERNGCLNDGRRRDNDEVTYFGRIGGHGPRGPRRPVRQGQRRTAEAANKENANEPRQTALRVHRSGPLMWPPVDGAPSPRIVQANEDACSMVAAPPGACSAPPPATPHECNCASLLSEDRRRPYQ